MLGAESGRPWTKNFGVFLLPREEKDGKQSINELFPHLSLGSPVIIQDLSHWERFSFNW